MPKVPEFGANTVLSSSELTRRGRRRAVSLRTVVSLNPLIPLMRLNEVWMLVSQGASGEGQGVQVWDPLHTGRGGGLHTGVSTRGPLVGRSVTYGDI